jgi:hypothetical protein
VAEVALGLAIVILIFRMKRTVVADHLDISRLTGAHDRSGPLALLALLLPASTFIILAV